jgi:hypothetical protein
MLRGLSVKALGHTENTEIQRTGLRSASSKDREFRTARRNTRITLALARGRFNNAAEPPFTQLKVVDCSSEVAFAEVGP